MFCEDSFLAGVVIGNKQFGILFSGFKALGNIRNACGGLDHDSFLGIKRPNFGTVIVGEKEFAFDIHQGVAKSFVVGSCESDVFVIILGFIIRRIEIEDGVRTVILLDELFEILVFDHHGL